MCPLGGQLQYAGRDQVRGKLRRLPALTIRRGPYRRAVLSLGAGPADGDDPLLRSDPGGGDIGDAAPGHLGQPGGAPRLGTAAYPRAGLQVHGDPDGAAVTARIESMPTGSMTSCPLSDTSPGSAWPSEAPGSDGVGGCPTPSSGERSAITTTAATASTTSPTASGAARRSHPGEPSRVRTTTSSRSVITGAGANRLGGGRTTFTSVGAVRPV